MADQHRVDGLLGQIEYSPTPRIKVNGLLGQIEYGQVPRILVSSLLGQIEYMIPSTEAPVTDTPGLFFLHG